MTDFKPNDLPFSDPFKNFLQMINEQKVYNMGIIKRYMPEGEAIFGIPLEKVNLSIIVDELKQANMEWWHINWARLQSRLMGNFND